MLNAKDLYSYYQVASLGPKTATGANPPTSNLGFTVITYQVQRYRDVRNLSDTFSYIVTCTQRIVIPNTNTYTPQASNTHPPAFLGYPAVVVNNVAATGLQLQELVAYAPRTLNTSIATSVSGSAGQSTSATMQHTSGSTTSQSNSFSASAALGFFGDSPSGDLSGSYGRTWGTERSRSVAKGSDTASDQQTGTSDSMSVKDWACNTTLGSDLSLTWVWGQEYPWDVVRYNSLSGALPDFIAQLLCDTTDSKTPLLLPPSQLSQFGIDFTMKASWSVQPTSSTSWFIGFDHSITYCTATHQLTAANSLDAFLNAASDFLISVPATLDICLYGLDPITEGAAGVAIIGFVPRQFLVLPAPATSSASPTPFRIISTSNTLLIDDTTDYTNLPAGNTGAGFTPSLTSLSATFTQNCTALTLRLSFKVTDTTNAYRLLLKHWINGSVPVLMTITVNEDTSTSMVKLITTPEGEGGEDNLLSISLRDLSYGSVNYHDYLNLGFNVIDITLAPATSDYSNCGYQIRAASVEKG